MNIQQGLEGLLREVETILGTDLAPQRRLYFEGAQHYLKVLMNMIEEGGRAKRPSRSKQAGKRAGESEDSKG